MRAPSFAARIIDWHARFGRHALPWQQTRDPYRIWLSEVMLQQTQVTTVMPYYARFLNAFPDLPALAAAPIDDVLAHWSGLGYYRRARHLHEAAKIIVRDHRGAFPRDIAAIAALPGIGRSTAAAIAAFAFGTRAAILDGNVKRVLARHRGIEGYPGTPEVERALWSAAEDELPSAHIEAYTQAIMDLGATVCLRTRPRCNVCPVTADCAARLTHRIAALPTPRPARALPQRAVQVLIIDRAGTWLFERRPSTGVWADLWSLPEVGCGDDVAHACRIRFGLHALQATPLPPVQHGFTHYHLTLHPVHVRIAVAHLVNAPGRTWLSREAALAGALPAPIKRIVEAHCVSATAAA